MTFTSGIRMIAMWFEPRRVPVTTQIFAQTGQIGQLLSAFPFLLILHGAGWLPAFISAAALSVLGGLAVLVATLTAGEPPFPVHAHRMGWGKTLSHLLEALRRPGTQIGFWTHFTLQPSLTMFMLLWGFPYLTVAVGLPPAVATLLFASTVITSAIIGPILGILSARFPFRRSNMTLGIIGSILTMWIVVLLWPGAPPIWLLVILLTCMAVGGPGAMLGFDYARTYNPARSQGSANGVVNVGGFLASFTIMFLVGVILDLLRDHSAGSLLSGLYSLDSFPRRVPCAVPGDRCRDRDGPASAPEDAEVPQGRGGHRGRTALGRRRPPTAPPGRVGTESPEGCARIDDRTLSGRFPFATDRRT